MACDCVFSGCFGKVLGCWGLYLGLGALWEKPRGGSGTVPLRAMQGKSAWLWLCTGAC